MADRLMYDAVNVDAIPADATMVAGYVDGGYVTWPELVQRFPHARKVSITTTGDSTADVIDVENGDAVPQKAVDWVRRMRHAGKRPIVYTSKDNLEAVIAAFEAEREAAPFWWIADWTGEPHLHPGSVATQYASPTVPPPYGPINYDVSLVSPNWPDAVAEKKPVINLPKNVTQQIGSIGRQIAAILGLVFTIGNQGNWPGGLRAVIGLGSALLLAVEHYVGDPSTGSPPPPPHA